MNQLEKFCPQLISAKVNVGRTQLRHRQGNQFKVRIVLALPRHMVVVNRNPDLDHAHEDPFIAVRDAFWAAKRQLTGIMKMNERLKRQKHLVPTHGIVERILLSNDAGFLKSEDGKDVYFNDKSVLRDDFSRVKPGQEVRFVEEQGEKGPQASSVQRVGKWGKHRIIPLY